MAATIKPIERKSVHQIQSGQVIGDGLISVVKELVENSLDAHATTIEVRFKNCGLDAVEVIDNGSGIAPDNYESIALKHWTSKLTTYDDLDSVTTFGFRGEALSSLCALSDLLVTTATAGEAPKGTRLEFETSGKLKSRSVAAAQRGTTVLVENIFKTLPVRRKELERNVKREYTKVLGVLQAYAGVCVGVKFSVFNQPVKGRRTPVFATKGNPTTRENIANVFGAKTLSALVALDLQFEMKSTRRGVREAESKEIKILGHISRPVVGEGRQAPDRQMFFVNGRPCVLPQIARAFNEVYKTFNVTQSPFIFADLKMDTNAYDVNVSPDKRSILLHDQTELLESLKNSLLTMFTNHEQTVPHAQLGKLPSYKQLTLNRATPAAAASSPVSSAKKPRRDVQRSGVEAVSAPRMDEPEPVVYNITPPPTSRDKTPPVSVVSVSAKLRDVNLKPQRRGKTPEPTKLLPVTTIDGARVEVVRVEDEEALPSPHPLPPPTPHPSLSYRSPRRREAKATITIGDREPVTAGSSPPPPGSPNKRRKVTATRSVGLRQPKFSAGALGRFAAPGTQVGVEEEEEEEVVEEEVEEDDVVVVEEEEEDDEEGGEEEEDMMMLDRADVNEDLAEVFRDASQREVIPLDGGENEAVDTNMEAVDQKPANPLFLPNSELDSLLSDDEALVEEAVVGTEQGVEEAEELFNAQEVEEAEEPFNAQEEEAEEPFNAQEVEDGDYPSENLTQSSLRAQQLLHEAEEVATQPTPKGLERAFQILEGSQALSTKNVVRSVPISLARIRQQVKTLLPTPRGLHYTSTSSGSSLTEDDVSAEARLNLTITKRDFFEMQIKGQFNRGFILATRADDLFIIDQHASDEKYNFETLQRDTVVQNQRLVVPKTLELMAMDEVVVAEHLGVFRKNGFVIEVDPDAPTGARCSLLTLPLSGNTVFGIKDLEELIHLVHERQGNCDAVRCSKVRSMFAMRACKKSTKVGKALTVKGMERIVRHMGELDKPWNCPHGRPTMRHLVELGRVAVWDERGVDGERGLQWKGQGWENVMVAMAE